MSGVTPESRAWAALQSALLSGLAVVVGLMLTVVVGFLAWAIMFIVAAQVMHVDERWPDGRTRRVRELAEGVLPPYPSATFSDVRVSAGIDSPYHECLAYRTRDSTDQVASYYHGLLEGQGWEIWKGVLEPRPVLNVSTAGGDGVFINLVADPPRMFSQGPLPGAEYTVQVCSFSWEKAVAKHRSLRSGRE
jgi:hypothetical protein